MRHVQRLGFLAGSAVLLMMVGSAPVSAQSSQISGLGVFDTTGTTCSGPPKGYDDYVDYPPIVLVGSLNGCWYTKVDTVKDHGAPSGVYLESGREVFVGSLNGGRVGLFTTTYKFQSKWDPNFSTGSEIWGRCEHPIVRGSGTDRFAGATGRLNFRDVVADGSYVYRGHISTP